MQLEKLNLGIHTYTVTHTSRAEERCFGPREQEQITCKGVKKDVMPCDGCSVFISAISMAFLLYGLFSLQLQS